MRLRTESKANVRYIWPLLDLRSFALVWKSKFVRLGNHDGRSKITSCLWFDQARWLGILGWQHSLFTREELTQVGSSRSNTEASVLLSRRLLPITCTSLEHKLIRCCPLAQSGCDVLIWPLLQVILFPILRWKSLFLGCSLLLLLKLLRSGGWIRSVSLIFKWLYKIRRSCRSINGIGLVAWSNFLFKPRWGLIRYEKLFLMIYCGCFTTVLHLNDCLIFEIIRRTKHGSILWKG